MARLLASLAPEVNTNEQLFNPKALRMSLRAFSSSRDVRVPA